MVKAFSVATKRTIFLVTIILSFQIKENPYKNLNKSHDKNKEFWKVYRDRMSPK